MHYDIIKIPKRYIACIAASGTYLQGGTFGQSMRCIKICIMFIKLSNVEEMATILVFIKFL